MNRTAVTYACDVLAQEKRRSVHSGRKAVIAVHVIGIAVRATLVKPQSRQETTSLRRSRVAADIPNLLTPGAGLERGKILSTMKQYRSSNRATITKGVGRILNRAQLFSSQWVRSSVDNSKISTF
jgi:hypothetical protein